jgi:hypothetical protein
MDEQPASVREVTELPQLLDFIEPAELRRLRDRKCSRLREMDVVSATQIRFDVAGTKLAVAGGDRDDFRSAKSFERAALVGLQMRRCGREHGFPGLQQRAKRRHVRTGAVKRKIDIRVVAEMLSQASDSARRPGIGAVGIRIPGIRVEDGLEYLGCDRRGIIAGEAATGR